MTVMRECSTHMVFLGASRTTLAPCLPAWRSHLGGYRHFIWKSLEKRNGTLFQNKHKALGTKIKRSACPVLWKSVKLPVLEHPGVSQQLKSERNDPLSNTRSESHLKKKYTYLHFSSPVRLEVKPPPCQAKCSLPLGRRQHLQLDSSADSTGQDLMINGVTIPLARTDQYRRSKMEIHVYVPSGKKLADAELLDEGYLEEIDKLSMLSLEDSIL